MAVKLFHRVRGGHCAPRISFLPLASGLAGALLLAGVSCYPQATPSPHSQSSTAASTSTEAYILPEELLSAWSEYTNRQGRDREALRRRLDQYLADNPDSPHAPEINVLIGSMYSYNAVDGREPIDTAIMRRYFIRAHQLYGDRYSILHDTAWSYLATSPWMDPEIKVAYYRWLEKAAEGLSTEDIHPVVPIEVLATQDSAPLHFPPGAMKNYVSNAQRDSRVLLDQQAIARQIVVGTQEPDLARLAQLAPGSRLAEAAQERLSLIAKAQAEAMVDDLGKASLTPLSTPVAREPEAPAAATPPPPVLVPETTNRSWLLIVTGLAILALVALAFVRRLRNRGD